MTAVIWEKKKRRNRNKKRRSPSGVVCSLSSFSLYSRARPKAIIATPSKLASMTGSVAENENNNINNDDGDDNNNNNNNEQRLN